MPAARDCSVGNALGWIKTYGFDGFRLDAIKHVEISWLTDLRARGSTPGRSDDQAARLPGRRDLHRRSRPHQALHRPVHQARRAVRLPAARAAGAERDHAPGHDERPGRVHGLRTTATTAPRVMSTVPRQPRRAAHHPLRRGHAAVARRVGQRQGPQLGESAGAVASANGYERVALGVRGPVDQSRRAAHLLRRRDRLAGRRRSRQPPLHAVDAATRRRNSALLGEVQKLGTLPRRTPGAAPRRPHHACPSTTTPGCTRWSTAPTRVYVARQPLGCAGDGRAVCRRARSPISSPAKA